MENRLTQEQAIKILNSRTLIQEPGLYQLKVTSVTPYQRKDSTMTNIVNFNAMTAYHAQEASELLKAGEFDNACNQSLSSSQRVGIDFTPAKGQIVDVVVTEQTTNNGVTGLFVASVQAMPVKNGGKIDFSKLFANEEEHPFNNEQEKPAEQPVEQPAVAPVAENAPVAEPEII